MSNLFAISRSYPKNPIQPSSTSNKSNSIDVENNVKQKNNRLKFFGNEAEVHSNSSQTISNPKIPHSSNIISQIEDNHLEALAMLAHLNDTLNQNPRMNDEDFAKRFIELKEEYKFINEICKEQHKIESRLFSLLKKILIMIFSLGRLLNQNKTVELNNQLDKKQIDHYKEFIKILYDKLNQVKPKHTPLSKSFSSVKKQQHDKVTIKIENTLIKYDYFNDRNAIYEKINGIIKQYYKKTYNNQPPDNEEFENDQKKLQAYIYFLKNLDPELNVPPNPSIIPNTTAYSNNDETVWQEYIKCFPRYACLSSENQKSKEKMNVEGLACNDLRIEICNKLGLADENAIIFNQDKSLNSTVIDKIKQLVKKQTAAVIIQSAYKKHLAKKNLQCEGIQIQPSLKRRGNSSSGLNALHKKNKSDNFIINTASYTSTTCIIEPDQNETKNMSESAQIEHTKHSKSNLKVLPNYLLNKEKISINSFKDLINELEQSANSQKQTSTTSNTRVKMPILHPDINSSHLKIVNVNEEIQLEMKKLKNSIEDHKYGSIFLCKPASFNGNSLYKMSILKNMICRLCGVPEPSMIPWKDYLSFIELFVKKKFHETVKNFFLDCLILDIITILRAGAIAEAGTSSNTNYIVLIPKIFSSLFKENSTQTKHENTIQTVRRNLESIYKENYSPSLLTQKIIESIYPQECSIPSLNREHLNIRIIGVKLSCVNDLLNNYKLEIPHQLSEMLDFIEYDNIEGNQAVDVERDNQEELISETEEERIFQNQSIF